MKFLFKNKRNKFNIFSVMTAKVYNVLSFSTKLTELPLDV